MTIRQLAFAGDSLTQGTEGGFSIAQGGRGSWADLVAERLANISELGPLLSSGMRGVWLGIIAGGSTEWAYTGAWTGVQSTDAFDKAPYGYSQLSPIPITQYASGSTNVATATLPTSFRPAVGFAIYWIDYTSGGNWSYSVDGGTTWINMGQTLANDNKLCKLYVATAITPGSTVKIRAANSAATAQGCLPVGIEWFYSTATNGLIVHNLGVNGTQVHYLTAATSGDRMAWFDSVVVGAGAITNQCSFYTCMHINDVLLNNTTNYTTDLGTFNTRLSGLGSILYINPYEVLPGTYNTTNQASYRAQLLTSATGFTPAQPTLDIYSRYSNTGWTGNAATNAAGLLNADLLHESQLGHYYIADYVYWQIRNLLGIGNVPSTYPVKGLRPTVAYTGPAPPTVAYAACAPISIG